MDISLGVDPNLIIKREQLNSFKSKSLIGNNQILNYKYKISIKNNKQSAVKVIMNDRIPVSQNKEIKIDHIDTGNTEYNNKTGIMKWTANILPQGKDEKEFSYQVKYTKGKHINL